MVWRQNTLAREDLIVSGVCLEPWALPRQYISAMASFWLSMPGLRAAKKRLRPERPSIC